MTACRELSTGSSMGCYTPRSTVPVLAEGPSHCIAFIELAYSVTKLKGPKCRVCHSQAFLISVLANHVGETVSPLVVGDR